MPIAMTSPPSDIKFAVNPTRSMTIKVASGVRIKGRGDDQGAADVAEKEEQDHNHQHDAFEQGLYNGVQGG